MTNDAHHIYCNALVQFRESIMLDIFVFDLQCTDYRVARYWIHGLVAHLAQEDRCRGGRRYIRVVGRYLGYRLSVSQDRITFKRYI